MVAGSGRVAVARVRGGQWEGVCSKGQGGLGG